MESQPRSQVAAAAALPTPAGSLPPEQDVIAELLDENNYLNRELEQKKRSADDAQSQLSQVLDRTVKKEKAIVDCLEALVGYCSTLERNVVQPAVGKLVECLQSNHPHVAAARDAVVAQISGLPVGRSAQPELALLFGQFQSPGSARAQTASDEYRRQVWSAVTQGTAYYEPEDAYTMVAALMAEKDQLQKLLRFCSSEIQGTRQPREVASHHRQMEILQQQNDNLKAEVQRLEQVATAAQANAQNATTDRERNERDVHALVSDMQALKSHNQRLQADFQCVLQEKNILSQQGKSLEATVREERSILHQKIESLQSANAMLQSQAQELRERCDRADREVEDVVHNRRVALEKLHAAERALQVAQQSQEEAERKALRLEQDRAVLRQKLEYGGGQMADDFVSKLQQERAENQRLRIELQRAGGDVLRGEMDRLRTEKEQQTVAFARFQEQAQASEAELRGRVQQLNSVAHRLRDEMRLLLDQRESAGAAAAPLPTGVASDGMRGRITSFEMCINQLDNEIGGVEGKIGALERGSEQTAAQMALIERERQFDQERTECDHIVQRMADELEILIRENQQLKSKQQWPPSTTTSPMRPQPRPWM